MNKSLNEENGRLAQTGADSDPPPPGKLEEGSASGHSYGLCEVLMRCRPRSKLIAL